jgi:hypothetical protein
MRRQSDHQADLERQLASEGTRPVQDEALIRRLRRERRLACETSATSASRTRQRADGPAKG